MSYQNYNNSCIFQLTSILRYLSRYYPIRVQCIKNVCMQGYLSTVAPNPCRRKYPKDILARKSLKSLIFTLKYLKALMFLIILYFRVLSLAGLAYLKVPERFQFKNNFKIFTILKSTTNFYQNGIKIVLYKL